MSCSCTARPLDYGIYIVLHVYCELLRFEGCFYSVNGLLLDLSDCCATGGVVIIYSRQQHFLLEDCKETMVRRLLMPLLIRCHRLVIRGLHP